MRKIAVVLSGCGYLDGTEITESVSTLIALGQAGADVTCFAPDIKLTEMDHLTAKPSGQTRSVLTESARVARGHVRNLTELNPKQFDAVVFPGGFGAAKNLSTWASEGAKAKVHPEVERVIRGFFSESKPIAAFCIAPTLLARVLGDQHITLTIGNDAATAAEILKTGAHHEECPVEDYITDREHKIVTSPAYMYEARPDQVFKGIQGAIRELVEMA